MRELWRSSLSASRGYIAVGNAAAHRHFKVKVFVAGNYGRHLRASKSIPVSAQPLRRGAPLSAFRAVAARRLRTPFQNGVTQRGINEVEAAGIHSKELSRQASQPRGKSCATPAIRNGAVHTETGNSFHPVINFLPVGKSPRPASSRADV